MDSSIEKTQVYVATAKSLSLGLPLQFIDPLLELGKMLDSAETWWEETSTQVTFFSTPSSSLKNEFFDETNFAWKRRYETHIHTHLLSRVFDLFKKFWRGKLSQLFSYKMQILVSWWKTSSF